MRCCRKARNPPAASVTTCAIAAPEEWLPRTAPVAASSRRRLRSEPPVEAPFSIWRNFHGRSLDVVGLAQRGAAGFPGAGIVAEHRAGAAHEQTVRATRFEAHQHAPRRGAPDRHLAFSLRPEIARHWCPRRHIPQPHRAFPCPHQHAGTVVIERRFEDPGQICPSVRRQRRTGQTSGPKAPAKADAEKGWDGRP